MQHHNSPKRVLVIEDEPAIGQLCLKTLTALGFEADIATNGRIAKDTLSKQVYDLYLSDIRTPEMNGIEFYKYLRKKRPELAGRVIFTTGDILSDEVKTLLSETNSPFLPKPFTPDELKAVVKEALKNRAGVNSTGS